MKLESLQDMNRFVAIGRYGGLAAAGRACDATPMQMSRCLSRLEARLGTSLAVRTTRSCRLTEEGQQFLVRCKRILAEVADTEELMEVSSPPSGMLSVSLPATFGYLHVAPLIPEFLKIYPDINMRIDYSDDSVNIIEEDFDLTMRIAHLTDSTLVARRIGTDRRLLIAAPSYLERKGKPKQPLDLLEHDCLVLSNPLPQSTWQFRDAEGQVHLVKVKPRLQASSRDGLYSAIIQGLGIGLFPNWEVKGDLRRGTVKLLLPDYGSDEIGIYIVFPKSAVVPPRVRAFSDYISTRLAKRLHDAP
jgi:DNA-binding transcriptional LysR family regulator